MDFFMLYRNSTNYLARNAIFPEIIQTVNHTSIIWLHKYASIYLSAIISFSISFSLTIFFFQSFVKTFKMTKAILRSPRIFILLLSPSFFLSIGVCDWKMWKQRQINISFEKEMIISNSPSQLISINE